MFFLRKTSTIHIWNFCSGMPLRKVHELTFLWFGLPGPLLKGRQEARREEGREGSRKEQKEEKKKGRKEERKKERK